MHKSSAQMTTKKNYTKQRFVFFSKIMNNIQLQSNNNKEMEENLMQILTQTKQTNKKNI